MADRGEQRLRKQMYKPKQFQKKKRIQPRGPARAVEGNNNTTITSNNSNNNSNNNDSDQDISGSSEDNSQEEIQTQRAEYSTTSTSNVERVLLQHSTDEQHIIRGTSEGTALQEERATDLEQFLLDVDQPCPSPLITANHEPHDAQLSQWLDSIAIKK